MPSCNSDACIKASTPEHNKNFVNKKREIVAGKLTKDLMIRPTQSSVSFFPVSSIILPSFRKTSILHYHFIFYLVCIIYCLFL